MILHQVIVTDDKDFILAWQNFTIQEMESMMNFIYLWATAANTYAIKIQRRPYL